jgi:disulfide bond formation protein DsbB
MTALHGLSNWPDKKLPWFILMLSALCFEVSALYFQYMMDLQPCIMCIYQRTAMLGIFFAGLIGFIANKHWFARLIAFGIWGTSAIWGMLIAIEHVGIQTSTSFFVMCEIVPNFPSWLQLHEWIPSFFAATGDCGNIDWQFVGYSMPQWMIVIFGLYSLTVVFMFLLRIFYSRSV